MAKVVVLMGSASDAERMRPCLDVLQKLEIDYFVTVTSAHRTPDRTERIVREQEANGARIFICAAGMAAHLAGVVAARSLRPVIGVPISGGALAGMDSLFSTVQMPPGFPVATVALDQAGAANAAWLAARILALNDPDLQARIAGALDEMRAKVERDGEKISCGEGRIGFMSGQ